MEMYYIPTTSNAILSIAKTSTDGLVDTYTITFQDLTSQTFTITNARSVLNVEKVSTDPLTFIDTYKINFNDGTYYKFELQNGTEGPKGEQGIAGKDGVNGTDGINGTDGNGIKDIKINENNEFIFTLNDGTEINAGSYNTNNIPDENSCNNASIAFVNLIWLVIPMSLLIRKKS